MTDALKLFLIGIAACALAYAAEQLLVPDVRVPINWFEDPQPVWQVQTAFLLKSTQAVAGMAAVLAIWLGAAAYVSRRWPAATRRSPR